MQRQFFRYEVGEFQNHESFSSYPVITKQGRFPLPEAAVEEFPTETAKINV